jgi:hypothetical protein
VLAGLCVAELRKLLGRGWLLPALLAPAVVVGLQGVGLRLEQVREALQGGTDGPAPLRCGFSAAAETLQTGAVVAAVIVGVFGALSLAEERQLGTLRLVLAGPVRRWQLYLARLLGLLALTLLLVGSVTLLALLVGAYLGDYVALSTWEYVDLTLAGLWRTFVVAVLLTAAAVFTVGCGALCASALTSSGSGSLILGAVIVGVALLLGNLGPPDAREAYAACCPLTYVTRPAAYVGEQVSAISATSWCIVLLPEGRQHWEAVLPWLSCLLAATLSTAVGLLALRCRDIH